MKGADTHGAAQPRGGKPSRFGGDRQRSKGRKERKRGTRKERRGTTHSTSFLFINKD